jgi:serine/threonine protein phosphatase 1
MRLLALGDIHGCTLAFDTLLELVRLSNDDQLVTLGDYVDRGPDSKGIIERLLGLHRKGQLVPLRGNHDQMMLDVYKGELDQKVWESCGGSTTLASYPGHALTWVDNVPKDHWHFLEEVCVDWYETDSHFFVHANVDPGLPLEDQPLFMLHWEKLFESTPHMSGKIMVCGHTPQKDGKPLNLGHAICLDTWVYAPAGWLTCQELETGKYWQANQLGEKRTGTLEAPVRIDMEEASE